MAAKRGGGMAGTRGRRGSIRQSSNGSWYFVVDVTEECGPRQQTRRRGFATRREAQTALSKTLRDLDNAAYVPPSRQLLGDYLTATWLPAVKTTVRPSTFDSYQRMMRVHVNEHPIAKRRLQQVTPADLNALYADLLAGAHRKRLSPRTVAYAHAILHRAFKDAVRWGALVRNPADVADPPRVRVSDRAPDRTWTAEELAAFLDACAAERLHALWHLIAFTGMRRGEALGLMWDDVDLENRTLSVARALVQNADYKAGKTGLGWSTPKTAKGRRSVALDPATVAVLRGHRARQLQERLRVGADYQDQSLVFSTQLGEPYHPKIASNMFRKAVLRHGMPYLSIHGLRHTWATLALRAGVHPRVVQERLGHSTVAITLDIYSHVNPALSADAANTVADLVTRHQNG
ncbi:MAG: tyrosine-type recombinase/integrase [Actinomycetes bacterium]